MSEVLDVKFVIEHGWFYLLIFEIFDGFSNHVNSIVKYKKKHSCIKLTVCIKKLVSWMGENVM